MSNNMPVLSDEQKMIFDAIAEISITEFSDKAFEWGGKPPSENIKLLSDRGFLGINVGEEYGGGGMGELEAILSIEAVGQVCPDTAEYLYTQQMIAARAIEMFGTERIKNDYLPGITSGKKSVVIAISEPEAGSDVAAMNTNVVEDTDELVVNGEKTWVSNVPHSDAAIVWAKFPEGLGSIILDLEADGVEVEQHYTNMAGHTQTHFYIENVSIPEDNVLTRGKDGFKNQLRALNWERLGSAALSNSIGLCATKHALDYSEHRKQFGQPISDFQGIEWKLADIVMELEASRTLTYQAAIDAVERGRIPTRIGSSIAKLYSSQMVEHVVSEALQIHGANGYQQEHPLEYLYRLARGRRIAAGTDEMMRNQIAAVIKEDGIPTI